MSESPSPQNVPGRRIRAILGADHGTFIGSSYQETFNIYRRNLRHIAMVTILLIVGMLYFGPEEKWDFNESLHFVVTTVTTVGYGYLYPTNAGSQIATIFYIFAGLTVISGILNARIRDIYIRFERDVSSTALTKMDRVREISLQLKSLFYFSVGLFISSLVVAGIYHEYRTVDWTYTQSYYFVIQTVTTIGYGDLPFEGKSLMAFTTFFVIVSYIAGTVFVEKICIILFQYRELRRREKIEKMRISPEFLQQLNASGTANSVEFLVGLLSYGNILDKVYDIDPILKLFTEFDKDNDGLLTVEDIQRLIEKYNETVDPNKSLVSILMDDAKQIFAGSGR